MSTLFTNDPTAGHTPIESDKPKEKVSLNPAAMAVFLQDTTKDKSLKDDDQVPPEVKTTDEIPVLTPEDLDGFDPSDVVSSTESLHEMTGSVASNITALLDDSQIEANGMAKDPNASVRPSGPVAFADDQADADKWYTWSDDIRATKVITADGSASATIFISGGGDKQYNAAMQLLAGMEEGDTVEIFLYLLSPWPENWNCIVSSVANCRAHVIGHLDCGHQFTDLLCLAACDEHAVGEFSVCHLNIRQDLTPTDRKALLELFNLGFFKEEDVLEFIKLKKSKMLFSDELKARLADVLTKRKKGNTPKSTEDEGDKEPRSEE